MSAQPANTLISIFYTVRTRTNTRRNASIKEVTQRIGDKQVMAPGEEIETVLVLDASTANPAWRYGMPLVVEQRDRTTPATVLAGVSDLGFPQKLVGGTQDLFLVKTAAAVADDLHGDVRAVTAISKGLFTVV